MLKALFKKFKLITSSVYYRAQHQWVMHFKRLSADVRHEESYILVCLPSVYQKHNVLLIVFSALKFAQINAN